MWAQKKWCVTKVAHCTFFPGSQCQNGWINYKNGCYKLVTPEDPWNLVTWSDAKKKCSTLFTGTQSANIKPHLLYIETMDELVSINTERSIIFFSFVDIRINGCKIRKRAKTRNRYNTAPHLTRTPIGKL